MKLSIAVGKLLAAGADRCEDWRLGAKGPPGKAAAGGIACPARLRNSRRYCGRATLVVAVLAGGFPFRASTLLGRYLDSL
jgi:hypothetical protein